MAVLVKLFKRCGERIVLCVDGKFRIGDNAGSHDVVGNARSMSKA